MENNIDKELPEIETLEVNGIRLDEKLISLIKRWQCSGNTMQKSDPERYIDYLDNIQDFLIRSLIDNGTDRNSVMDLLEKLMLIKDELSFLVPADRYTVCLFKMEYKFNNT